MNDEKSYKMRARTRRTWRDIGAQIGISKNMARDGAMRWASRQSLPPPPRVLTLGEMAYEDRAAGATWDEIRYTLRLSNESVARNRAYSHAKSHGLPWPPEGAT